MLRYQPGSDETDLPRYKKMIDELIAAGKTKKFSKKERKARKAELDAMPEDIDLDEAQSDEDEGDSDQGDSDDDGFIVDDDDDEDDVGGYILVFIPVLFVFCLCFPILCFCFSGGERGREGAGVGSFLGVLICIPYG